MGKRGRPRKNDALRNVIRVRISDEDLAKLEYVQSVTDKSVSEIVRNGIDRYYKFEIHNMGMYPF